MKQKSTSMIAVLSVVFLGLLTGMNGQLLGQGGTVVSKFGQAQVAGRNVIVHVTVVVPPGANANQVALDAVRNQGGRPFQGDEFSTTGLAWSQFLDTDSTNDTVIQNYNPADDPTSGVLAVLMDAQSTWTGVRYSKFAFSIGTVTDRCPSLVKECKGPQTFDGNNDVAWLPIRGCCTLAVTWYGTSLAEADMAINTNFSWSTTGGNGYDLESVILHENGHVVGLGHSPVTKAVMFATYSEPRILLHDDDMAGISSLYPAEGSTGTISGTVTGISPNVATVKVDNNPVSTITEDDGTYIIPDVLAPGPYTVTASASGYSSETSDPITVTAGADTGGVDFVLVVDQSPAESLAISNVDSQTSGKGGNFKITWTTTIAADSEVTFNCCGAFTNSEPVTSHSMSFRGKKGDTYTYRVSSTDADGNTVSDGPYSHSN